MQLWEKEYIMFDVQKCSCIVHRPLSACYILREVITTALTLGRRIPEQRDHLHRHLLTDSLRPIQAQSLLR